jgi:hypothetical protein
MGKNINVEYTKPVTGLQATVQATVEIERYRRDTEEGAMENFFLKVTASGATLITEDVDDLVADLLDGKPSGVKKGVVQAMVDAAFTADGTTLSVTPAADVAGFVAHVPCVVLDKYGSVIDWFIPTAIGADFTIPAGPSEEAALHNDCEIGWIVQQAQAFLSPLGENSQLGIKAQLERPSTPTGVSGSGSVGAGINVGWTKPSDVVIQYYDVYCIKASVQPTIIEPNDLPSVEDRAASLGSVDVNLTQYFDETTMELKALDAGDYFVGVVAKDGAGRYKINESAIGWSAKITIA